MNFCKDCHSCIKPCGREEGRMDWNTYFIKLAEAASLRSKDPKTQVGCVIVNSDNHIVSTGYNGLPPGFPDDPTNWLPGKKYFYVVHAEMNALLHSTQYTKDCRLYTTLSPCGDCAKAICAAGISEVYYLIERKDDITTELFEGCGISCEQVGG